MSFDVLFTDPPWKYYVRSEKGLSRSAENHYGTEPMDYLFSLSELVKRVMNPNSVCLMWATYPCLPDAFRLLEAWGYTYKTVAFTWAKMNRLADGKWTTVRHPSNWFIGNGYWTRANPEIVLLGTRGKKFPRRVDLGVRNFVPHPIYKEHSRKPDSIYDDTVRLLGPDWNYLEQFARRPREGWTVMGNEIDGLDMADALRAYCYEHGL